MQQLKSALAPASCQTGNHFLSQNYKLRQNSPTTPKRACFSQKTVFLDAEATLLRRVTVAWVPKIPEEARGGSRVALQGRGPAGKARHGCEESGEPPWEPRPPRAGWRFPSRRELTWVIWEARGPQGAGQASSGGVGTVVKRHVYGFSSFHPLVFRGLTLPLRVS